MKKLVLIVAAILSFAAMSCSSAKTSSDTTPVADASKNAAPAQKSPVDLGASSAGRGA